MVTNIMRRRHNTNKHRRSSQSTQTAFGPYQFIGTFDGFQFFWYKSPRRVQKFCIFLSIIQRTHSWLF